MDHRTSTPHPSAEPWPDPGVWPDLISNHFKQSESLVLIALDREGRIRAFNRAAEALTGYAEAEVLSRSWFELMTPPERFPEVQAEFQRLLEGGPSQRFQNPILTKAGDTRILSWCNDLLLSGGQVVGILSYGQDVTQPAQLQEEHQRQHELLRRIFDTAHFSLAYLDRDFTFLRVNKAYAEASGFPPEYFLGKNHFDLFPHAENEALFRQVVATGEPYTAVAKPFDYPDHPERGVTYWDWTLHPVKDRAGRVEGLLLVLLDVTERKRMETQLMQMQRMESLGRLAGGIAHDFNNLLTAIQGYAGMGELEAQPHARILEQFRGIENIADRAAQLTRQLLAFARRQATHPEVLDLNALTQGLFRLLRHLLGDGVELVVLPAEGPCPVKADASQLEQVLVNLAINARDAMEGRGTLTVETALVHCTDGAPCPGLPPGDYARWTVKDTGPGMTPDVAARIFEPFFTTKPEHQGTGLGLATCHGIVRQHGGAILLDTAPGRGACFTVVLPCTKEIPSTVPAATRELPRGTETLLLIEDQSAVRQTAKRILEPLGYRVLEAGQGVEALRHAEAYPGPIHLAIVDLMLPGEGGEAVAQHLRVTRPDLKILFVSGYAETYPEAIQAQAPWAAFLDKPFSPSQLAQAVRSLLNPTQDSGSKR